jgi:WD40 repeat protein
LDLYPRFLHNLGSEHRLPFQGIRQLNIPISTYYITPDMPQLQLIADLPGHPDPAWSVAFNSTRPLIASCSTDRTVRLYHYVLPQSDPTATSSTSGDGHDEARDDQGVFPSADSPKPRIELLSVIPTQHKKSIRSVAWAPSGKTLATGSFDSTVGVWEEVDPEDAEAEGEEGTEGVVRSKSGLKASEEEDDDEEQGGPEEIKKNGKEWECVTTLEGHESECKSVGFSSDGSLLASCSRDRSVWVWEGERLSVNSIMTNSKKLPALTFQSSPILTSNASLS